MVNTEYANAYSEVLEILKYIPLEDYKKIPEEKLQLYKDNANAKHNFKYNPNKTLDEQDVSQIAKGIIAILFRDYWATEEQRTKILSSQKYARYSLEEEKKLKYDPNNIFKTSEKIPNEIPNEISNEIENANKLIKSEKWYHKILEFIKKILNK